jgi:hypothetical protein
MAIRRSLLISRKLCRLGLRACGDVVRHSGPVGIDSRTVALAVLSVVAAVVLGFEAGVRAGALAGVLAALAGFVPAVVWELTRDLRERNARVAERRKAALKAFVPAVAPPAAGGAVAGSAGGRGAAWYLRPEAQVVAFRPRPELSQLRAWCVAGGRLGVRLVTGEGGAGKTRLALQLAADLASDGWRTMWVQPGQEGTAVGMVRDTGEPAVLAVDYAETRPGLADLLAEAAAAEDCPDLRVLLLCVSPFADREITMSSTPVSRCCLLATIFGSKLASRSRGTVMSTGPVSVITVLARCPLRELPPSRPAGSCFP